MHLLYTDAMSALEGTNTEHDLTLQLLTYCSQFIKEDSQENRQIQCSGKSAIVETWTKCHGNNDDESV